MRKLLGLMVAVCCSVAGCGGDDGGPSGPTIDELGPMIATTVCGEVKECEGSTFLADRLGGDSCVDSLSAQIEDKTFVELAAAIEAGTASYHADQAEACLSSIRKTGCGITAQRLGEIGDCAKVFVGTVEVGGDCDIDGSCAGDAFCKRDTTCPGACTERASAGETCSRDEECKTGLSCNGLGRCETPSSDGEACGGGIAPDCALGLICAGASDAMMKTGKCTSNEVAFAAKEGAACELASGKLCEPPLSCAAVTTGLTTTFVCKKQVAAGAACTIAVPSLCPDEQACDGMGAKEGKCQPLPRAGEACATATSTSPQCAPGFTCGSDDKCRTIGRLGDDCADDSDCASEHCDKDKCADAELCALK